VRDSFSTLSEIVRIVTQTTEQHLVESGERLRQMELNLKSKADIQDVSSAMTEVIVTTDCRKQLDKVIEELERTAMELAELASR
jgi:predicted regulator of amino acid metabolism with ACT domain